MSNENNPKPFKTIRSCVAGGFCWAEFVSSGERRLRRSSANICVFSSDEGALAEVGPKMLLSFSGESLLTGAGSRARCSAPYTPTNSKNI